MLLIFKLSLKELRGSLRALRSVLFILVIGFIGPLCASAVHSSVEKYLTEKSREILSADLAVSSTRDFNEDELQTIARVLTPLKTAQETEFITMAQGHGAASLVEIDGVDATYPVFGGFQLAGQALQKNAAALSDAPLTDAVSAAPAAGDAGAQFAPPAWVYPEVLAQLNVKLGDLITVGRAHFRIAGNLTQGPGLAQGGMGVAPRIYVGRKFIASTGLTKFGSQIYHRVYVQLPKGISAEIAAKFIKDALDDPDIFLRTPQDAIQSFERFFSFFNLYLVVITMIVFGLSWMSAFYILQIYLQDRLRNAAVVMTMGASRLFTGLLYALQITAIVLCSYVLAWLILQSVFSFLSATFGARFPPGFILTLGLGDTALFASVALISSLSFAFPLFIQLYSVRLQTLLSEDALSITGVSGNSRWRRWGRRIATYAPLIGVFQVLAIWLMDDWRFAVELLGGMALAGLVGLLLARLVFNIFFRVMRLRQGMWRLVAIQLSRARFGTNLCFLALILVALVLNVVPHLLKSVTGELQPLQAKEFPALFLFNIPEGDVADVQKFVSENAAELRFVSPLIQARLIKVNTEPPRSDFLLRFPVRISYREKPIASEKLIIGTAFDGPFKGIGLPGISVEIKFAERNGFKLGDHLEFDVQGVPVEGKIVNLRRVRWTDFNPNFFMLFQPGVLEDAPKTFLANVMVAGQDEKVKLQFHLLQRFPDLSVIDIGRTIARGLEVAASVISPIRLTSYLAIFMSFIILSAVVSHNMVLRRPEIDVQKMMGADVGFLRALVLSEYVVLSTLAFLIGSSAALILAWAVTQKMLDIPLRLSVSALGLSFLVTVGATSLIVWYSSGRELRARGGPERKI
jgi:putative ABC transport system permease protein